MSVSKVDTSQLQKTTSIVRVSQNSCSHAVRLDLRLQTYQETILYTQKGCPERRVVSVIRHSCFQILTDVFNVLQVFQERFCCRCIHCTIPIHRTKQSSTVRCFVLERFSEDHETWRCHNSETPAPVVRVQDTTVINIQTPISPLLLWQLEIVRIRVRVTHRCWRISCIDRREQMGGRLSLRQRLSNKRRWRISEFSWWHLTCFRRGRVVKKHRCIHSKGFVVSVRFKTRGCNAHDFLFQQ